MSKIDELLKNEKVEWKKVSDVIFQYKEKQRDDNKINLVYTVSKDFGIISSLDYWMKNNEDGKYTNYSEDISNYNIIRKNMFAYNPSRLNIGSIDCLFDKPEGVLSPMYVIFRINESVISPEYLLYYLKSEKILNLIDSKKEQGARFRFDFERWNYIEIPIPSLETQEKIVKILDEFKNYVSELEAELKARDKQYEHYRNMLLSEDYLKKISEKFLDYKEEYEVRKFTIEDIAKIKNGKDWKNLGKGNTPVYGSGGKMDVYVNEHSYNKPTVLIPRKGSIENIFYVDEPFWNVDTIYYTEIDETKIRPKYFYYFMKTIDLKSLSTNSTRPSLTQSILNKIKINVPPIAIQNKVVEVLDKFQDLLSDTQGLLPEEIEQRQKQYEYYREKLLTFEDKSDSTPHAARRKITLRSYFATLKQACDIVGVRFAGVEWKKLGEIAKGKLEYGSGTKAVIYDNRVRYIRITDIDENGNLKREKVSPKNIEEKFYLKSGDLLFARSGATVGKNYLYDGEENSAIFAGYLIRLRVDEKIAIPKYVYYCVKTSIYRSFVNETMSIASQPNINAKQYSEYKILVPPIEVQEYVVSILDKFDRLVNDINEGLPKEIELRQKQHEYYRERLLNFPK